LGSSDQPSSTSGLSSESTREALERLARLLEPLAGDVAVQSQRLLLAAGGEQLLDGLDLVIEGSWVLGQAAQADVLVQAPEVRLEVLDIDREHPEMQRSDEDLRARVSADAYDAQPVA
jgi:hypothetical protein